MFSNMSFGSRLSNRDRRKFALGESANFNTARSALNFHKITAKFDVIFVVKKEGSHVVLNVDT
jgi:hypothetical protein